MAQKGGCLSEPVSIALGSTSAQLAALGVTLPGLGAGLPSAASAPEKSSLEREQYTVIFHPGTEAWCCVQEPAHAQPVSLSLPSLALLCMAPQRLSCSVQPAPACCPLRPWNLPPAQSPLGLSCLPHNLSVP